MTNDEIRPIRVALNGFGRIGRQVLRQITLHHPELEVALINTRSGNPAAMSYLFRFDTVFGRFPRAVTHDDEHLVVDGRAIRVLNQPDPLLCPWHAFDIDVVIEATGSFTDRTSAAAHLKAGARKVLITAPARDADATIVYGVNHDIYDPERMHVISAASCTTNCLAPMVAVLHERFGVVGGLMTTIHAFTRDQELLDSVHDDPRRGRAAGFNLTPTKTGAARAIGEVLPELAGRLVGLAVRVPVPDVSLVDLVVTLDTPATVEDVNTAFTEAAASERWQGILAVSDEPLVSSDYLGDLHSCTVDLTSTRGGPAHQIKVLGWYDNEAGYAARVIDLALLLGGRAPAVAPSESGTLVGAGVDRP